MAIDPSSIQWDDAPAQAAAASGPAAILQKNMPFIGKQQSSYLTQLPPDQEAKFQSWVKQNNVPFDPSPTADYDMRGFYSGLQKGDPNARTGMNANDGKMHFGDYYKTPYHKSFSSESQFANKDAPRWNEKDQLVTPDGRVVFDERAGMPDPAGVTWDEPATAQAMPANVPVQAAAPSGTHQAGRFGSLPMLPPNAGQELMQDAGNVLAGAGRGAASIGATMLAPYDVVNDALAGKGLSLERNRHRRADVDEMMQTLGANQNSLPYQAGKLGTEIAGTAGMGGLLANGARALPGAAKISPLIESIGSGGFKVGGMTGLPALATRMVGGGITGGASAGLVNPEDASTGVMIGGAVPGAAAVVGNTTRAVGRAIRGGEISPEVAGLVQKAKNLDIDIPADRVVNSKPMNALAASLEYMPFSGRTATIDKMQGQLNRAVSRTFGQDSDNVTMALRKAQGDLGSKFDTVLQSNKVKIDPTFTQELADHAQRASSELESGQASIIQKQIEEIMSKAQNGEIDGQAAYNIKKTLDRIGQRNSPEAWYAGDLKKSLMGALNRSLKPDEAAAFAKVRQQYGTMLDLKKLAQNGADGDISIARLANMKNIGNPELQDIADISAQFLKSRESPHGAMQRLMLGGLGAAGAGSGMVSPLLFGGAVAAGRGANAALNSNALRSLLLRAPSQGGGLLSLGAEKANKVLPLLAPHLINDQ
ncbi:hypothetical protein [Pseudomonas sp. C9]|uniref:hypothetical protein n=1 Tax=Pseudomonas sp. C9 TaxID=1311337 RepID=UPI000984CC73|nr:hypothetical protein [Pseudomonas sp. C9]OOG11277.1 hypothetical protein BMS17_03940 [Pseudomonas sp. C9]